MTYFNSDIAFGNLTHIKSNSRNHVFRKLAALKKLERMLQKNWRNILLVNFLSFSFLGFRCSLSWILKRKTTKLSLGKQDVYQM